VHPRLALNSLSTATWSLEQDLDLYTELGVPAGAWYAEKLERAGIDRAVDLIGQSGIRSVQVFARGFTLHDRSSWVDDRIRLRRAVEAAVALGAPWVALTAGPAGDLDWDEAADALGEAIAPLLGHGVGIAIEPSLPVRVEVGFLHSLRDGVDLADRLDVGTVVECNYVFAERDLAGTLRRGADRIATVQVSDLVSPSTTIPDRAVPGDGVIPLRRVLGLAIDAGYRGDVEIEMLGPRIEAEGYGSAVRRAVAEVDRMLQELDPR